MRAGRPMLKSPLLFVLGAAVVTLARHARRRPVLRSGSCDLHDSSGWAKHGLATLPFADGHFLLVVSAATLAALGGVLYWCPKVFGRLANDGLAKLAALVGVVGGLVAGLPLLVYGFALKSSSLFDSAHFLNGTSALGTAAAWRSRSSWSSWPLLMGRRGPDDDAWGVGQTLEWSVPSPPRRRRIRSDSDEWSRPSRSSTAADAGEEAS